MQKVLVVDNFDSFVYNLVQLLRESGLCEFDVVKNNAINMETLSNYDAVLLSPGPGIPETSNQLLELIAKIQYSHVILGICLGHQAIARHFGVKLRQLGQPKHGHLSRLQHLDKHSKLLNGIVENSIVGRYHSWVVDGEDFDRQNRLIATAWDEDNNIMAIEHRDYPIYGVQFHPESVISECGKQLILNWLHSNL